MNRASCRPSRTSTGSVREGGGPMMVASIARNLHDEVIRLREAMFAEGHCEGERDGLEYSTCVDCRWCASDHCDVDGMELPEGDL